MNYGRILVLVGISCAIVFGIIFASVSIYVGFFDSGQPSILHDPLAFNFILVLPLVLTLGSLSLIRVGSQMQKGRDKRLGAVILILLGFLCLSISLASMFSPIETGTFFTRVKGAGWFTAFGLLAVTSGFAMMRKTI